VDHYSGATRNVTVTLRVADCTYLLTEDLQHGQDLDGLKVIDPFQAVPGDLI